MIVFNTAGNCCLSTVQAYFEGLSFEIPAHINPADAFLDIVSGAIQPLSGKQLDIADCWLTLRGTQQATMGAAGNSVELLGVAQEVATPDSNDKDALLLSKCQKAGASSNQTYQVRALSQSFE
jgi:hypothetical protein